MEHRLNDVPLLASLDAGHQSLLWDPGQASGLLAPLDLRALAADPHVAEIVPSLPVQSLYYALKQQGVEEALDILPYVSQEQTERMVDYEAWQRDDLQPRKLFQFVSLFGEVSPELMAERFSELDEEYQLACLTGRFRVYEAESIMDLPDELQERVSTMPCGKVFYEIVTDDADEKALIDQIFDACKDYNLRYAYSLLAHTAHMPPHEQELQLRQFRMARLEEDGFVSFADSLELFLPFDAGALRQRWSVAAPLGQDAVLENAASDLAFLDQVFALAQQSAVDLDALFQLHQGFLFLANAMCAVTQTEAYDFQAVQRLMEQGKAMVNFGLESLAQGQVELGLEILLKEPARVLFRYGLSLVDQLRGEVLEKLAALGLPRVAELQKAYQLRQWGRLLLEIDRHWLDIIGLEAAETLKGLFNRFPMRPMQTNEEVQRVLFVPIRTRADALEFRYSLATLLGYFASVERTGEPLTQPFEVILRDHAIRSLAEGAVGAYAQLETDIPQLLEAWRDGLRQNAERWMLKGLSIEAVLDDVAALIHNGLHGLIILPSRRAGGETPNDEERM